MAVPQRARRVQRLLQARKDYLVTNVFDEQLPDNSVASWCAPATEAHKWKDYDLPIIRGSGYLRPEYARHLARLAGELTRAAPNLIVPLGATALWALTGVSDISLVRGAVTSAQLVAPGVKLLPTFHPAHVQMEWRLFHVAVADLVKAAKEAEYPDVRLVKRHIHIRPLVRDLSAWVDRLLAADRLSVDIETSKQQITCIGFAPNAEEAFVIPFADFGKASRCYWDSCEDEVAAWQAVRTLCESSIPKVFQNGLYDTYYLIRQAGIWVNGYEEDTRLQHHALYPELPKSLAFMGATYGQQGPWKLMRAKKSEKRDE